MCLRLCLRLLCNRWNEYRLACYSCPQRLHSFWSAPRIETSGMVQHRKSTIHGLFVTLCTFRVKSDNLIGWEHETNSLRLFRKLILSIGRDSWCWPNGPRPLGTRMRSGITQARGYLPHVAKFGQWKHWVQITSRLISSKCSDDFANIIQNFFPAMLSLSYQSHLIADGCL